MRRFLTCLLLAAGLFLAQNAWAAPAVAGKTAPPPTPRKAVAAPSTGSFADFLAGFIPCPLCSPHFPCPRCP
jgi:hypothetical protein